MALSNVRQPNFTLDLNRIELAQRALHQIEALLPIAQRQADTGGGESDAMLGLLGRICEMNDVAMELLLDVVDGSEPSDDFVQRKRVEILGRREVSHD